MPIERFTFDHSDFVVSYEAKEYLFSFVAYSVASTGENGDDPDFERLGSESSYDRTPNLSEAQPFVSGDLKRDGCANFKFDEQEHVMLHTCSKEEAVEIGLLLGAIYDLADRTIG